METFSSITKEQLRVLSLPSGMKDALTLCRTQGAQELSFAEKAGGWKGCPCCVRCRNAEEILMYQELHCLVAGWSRHLTACLSKPPTYVYFYYFHGCLAHSLLSCSLSMSCARYQPASGQNLHACGSEEDGCRTGAGHPS